MPRYTLYFCVSSYVRQFENKAVSVYPVLYLYYVNIQQSSQNNCLLMHRFDLLISEDVYYYHLQE